MVVLDTFVVFICGTTLGAIVMFMVCGFGIAVKEQEAYMKGYIAGKKDKEDE